MKAVKIKAYASSANFRKPSSFQIKESFPLPPYSTVIGMVHTACGYRQYVPMRVAVQGSYESVVNDLYTRYEFLAFDKNDLSRHNLVIEDNGQTFGLYSVNKTIVSKGKKDWKKYGVNRGTGYVETLIGLKLILHICPDEQARIDEIYNGIKYPQTFLALGRHEDLLCIEDIAIVEITEQDHDVILEHDLYIPELYLDRWDYDLRPKGTFFKLNKVFAIDSKTGVRRWDKPIRACYAAQGSSLENLLPVDSEGDVALII
ncbi:CRISPR-associated protein [Pelotomaculum schinkii]|uniref:CRISPR-associated protein n=1 Tax=Pelotomaculum schinkii TaxID=78350 RepID=A0A4Y7RB59_9FIRM|nr:CRISPR-associated protein Cas5 [Pelotomaculum schinkii]TEB05979.1 CRISPR-associated protein [Pelotomaculum schinkii]